tara:strand:+ start:7951 stop:8232 length:282 start_codon:yes stop_codon:yes gene_type:complete
LKPVGHKCFDIVVRAKLSNFTGIVIFRTAYALGYFLGCHARDVEGVDPCNSLARKGDALKCGAGGNLAGKALVFAGNILFVKFRELKISRTAG